jgi:hypothetical protein
LMQYETINVLATNSYNYAHRLRDVCIAIKTYDEAGGLVFERLTEICPTRKKLKFIKKEISVFFFFLNNIVKTKRIPLIACLFWLKLTIKKY